MKVLVVYNLDIGSTFGDEYDYLAIQDTEHTATAIHNALLSQGYSSFLISVSQSVEELKNKLSAFNPQECFIFNNCDGFQGISTRAAELVALMEEMGFCHTSATADSILRSTNKRIAKEMLQKVGVPTPVSQLCTTPNDPVSIPLPVIVKPVAEEASLGISLKSVITSPAQLPEALHYVISTYQQPALVEQFICGRELVSAVMGNGDQTQILPTSEMDFSLITNPLEQILTYESKWVEGTFYYEQIEVICPASLSQQERKAVEEVSLACYQTLGLRDFCRVDIRMQNGIPYVLEANDLPDLAPQSGFSRAAFAAGYTYEGMIEAILKIAMLREGWTEPNRMLDGKESAKNR